MAKHNEGPYPGSSNPNTPNNQNIGGTQVMQEPGSWSIGPEQSTPIKSFQEATADTNRVFSGADLVAFILPKADESEPMVPLRNLAALSYSIHRDKVPVRSLGTPRAKSYTLGTRTIAGTIVMINLDRAALSELLYRQSYYDESIQVNLYDEIPPFDVMITFSNEQSGSMYTQGMNAFTKTKLTNDEGIEVMPPNAMEKEFSLFKLTNIRLIDEGMVTGTDEAFLETTFQYVAEDIQYLKPVSIKVATQ